jgi:hypothetical protein
MTAGGLSGMHRLFYNQAHIVINAQVDAAAVCKLIIHSQGGMKMIGPDDAIAIIPLARFCKECLRLSEKK